MATKTKRPVKTIPVQRTCGHVTDVIYTGPTSTKWSIESHYKLTPCVPCKKSLALRGHD